MKNKKCDLILGDCLKELPKIEEGSVNMIFADPPYFLSNDGFSVHAGKRVSVNKGEWDRSRGFTENLEFTRKWISLCKKILTDNGTMWVSGTLHNVYLIGFVLEETGFKIINDVSWFKPNGPPHLACRYFAHSHEMILWAKKNKNSRHVFNYDLMKKWDASNDFIKNKGKQMRSVWSIPLTPQREKSHGKHPTQKPEELLKRIVLSSTNKGETVLDPFMGSGTTGVVSLNFGRNFKGIEIDKNYFEISRRRIGNGLNKKDLSDYVKVKKISPTNRRGGKRNLEIPVKK